MDLLGGRWNWWRGLLLAGLITWALTALAAYWADPTDPRVLISLAFKSNGGGHLDTAIAEARIALTIDPHYAPSRLALIRFLRKRNPDDPEIDQLLAAFPAATQATIAPGIVQSSASAAFDAGLLNVQAAAQHVQQMHHCLQRGDVADAIAQAGLAAQLDPDSLDILDIYNSAYALSRDAGHLDQAIIYLREAIRMVPYLAQFHAEPGRSSP